MLDDRPSVITLARSASHQVSKVWDRPSEYRLSVDENPERGARSEADVTPMQLQRQSHDLEQPLLVQAHDINHDTHSEISVESTGLSRYAVEIFGPKVKRQSEIMFHQVDSFPFFSRWILRHQPFIELE